MDTSALLPKRRIEELPGYAISFTLWLRPIPEHREEVVNQCQLLVQYARDSRDCMAGVYGERSGDDGEIVCHSLFGADGPFSRFTSIRSSNKAYRVFRKTVELTAERRSQAFGLPQSCRVRERCLAVWRTNSHPNPLSLFRLYTSPPAND